jgi:GT2 family glycosyltransferase
LISVIIPTYNRNDLLAKCLDCLSPDNQLIDLSVYEVIVTDDGIENQARGLITKKYPWVKWVEGPKKGPAANRNNGAKYAKGEWLLFTDDDCLPDKNMLNEYLKAINSLPSLVFEGLTKADRPRLRFDEESPINLYGGNLWSCNFCIHKKYFFNLLGFDERYPYPAMEDVDLRTRIEKSEMILFLPTAIVIHPWRKIHAINDFIKHFNSSRYYFKIHKVDSKIDYRISRIKIFLGNFTTNIILLAKFHFKGFKVFIFRTLLEFCLIFI